MPRPTATCAAIAAQPWVTGWLAVRTDQAPIGAIPDLQTPPRLVRKENRVSGESWPEVGLNRAFERPGRWRSGYAL